LSTEEDGVDEAGRTSQPPLIMAPPDLIADPDGDATDTIVDNGIMSSSRTGTGSSRSGVSKRTAGANGNSSTSGDPEAAAPEATTGEDTTEVGSSTTVPLPADTIRKAKGQSDSSGATEDKGRSSEPQGSRKTMSSGESAWATARKTETAESADSADAMTAAAPAAPAANKTSPVKDDRKPSFTPTAATPAASAPAAAVASAAPTTEAPTTVAPTTATPAAPAPQASSYSAAGASHPSSSGYSRSAWSAAADATATSGPAPAPAPARPAPAGDNGRPSGNGFSTGAAASTVTGAAAGLANSVSSAWQKRGSASARTIKTRKSTKRQAMLTLARVEPWSVMKFSFVASVVAFIILFVAVAVLYMVLSALGVFDSLQHTVSSITSSQSDAGTNISHWFSASLILGYTAMLGALNIVLITAMSTVGSVIYNLIAKTIGGIEVTLRETD
jgi:Transmembrane domain of unknown function (DUF3566)